MLSNLSLIELYALDGVSTFSGFPYDLDSGLVLLHLGHLGHPSGGSAAPKTEGDSARRSKSAENRDMTDVIPAETNS